MDFLNGDVFGNAPVALYTGVGLLAVHAAIRMWTSSSSASGGGAGKRGRKLDTYHCIGYAQCGPHKRAVRAAKSLEAYGVKVVERTFVDKAAFKEWLASDAGRQLARSFGSPRALEHATSPFCFTNGGETFIGGGDDTQAFVSNYKATVPAPASAAANPAKRPRVEEKRWLPPADTGTYDYDLVVIGGGSGGLAASKEAAKQGAKVVVLDCVRPSPQGTTWGLGGTCVNVGCIPKKLMHRSAVIGDALKEDAPPHGWTVDAGKTTHDWATMQSNITMHIKSLNFGYRASLREKTVEYKNAFGSFVDAHTIKCTHYDRKDPFKVKKEETITAKHVILAVGGRPRLPRDVPGAVEHAITSDDIFSWPKPPGRTLVVGGSYVALECAGFLKGCGYDVTVAVRSILLRGFDQEMANKIGDHMENHQGVKFVRGKLPSQIDKEASGALKVTFKNKAGNEDEVHEYDTVLYAIGRDPCTKALHLDTAGVSIDSKTGKVPVDAYEQTSVPHIFCIGDAMLNPVPKFRDLELTPVAIQSGVLLAQRLYAPAEVMVGRMDYNAVATTVFTPLEYGCVGLSEDDASDALGPDLDVYHQNFVPLEWALAHGDPNTCYTKVLVDKSRDEEVVGIHYLGPNAGEVMQGFSLAIKCKISKSMLDSVVGIHPTTAENVVGLSITKSSGADASAKGC